MNDLISRQAAIDAVMDTEPMFSLNSLEPYQKTSDVIRALEKLSPAQQWIPCSERLPERKEQSQMRGYYLTTNSYGAVSLTRYEFERESFGFVGWDSDIQIVAWMPLPQPYRESEE